jgi:acyl-CoA thioesterase-1
MDWVIYLFGSGIVFFVGVAMILGAVPVFFNCERPWLRAGASLLVVCGMLLIAFSATPLPYWLYVLAGLTTVMWLIAERFPQGWLLARRNRLRGLVAGLWIAAAAIELPYHMQESIAATGNPTLYIIGDSVAAGTGAEQQTWPRLLAATRRVEVIDLARVGATAASALRQAEGLPAQGGLVLLEIGGNDLLGSTSAGDFERHLDRLLDRVCVPGRAVLMFELPLPPFRNEFGRIQRRLAALHGVVLIPKRVFVTVLTADGATIDSVHLARAGHERMADVVWALIEPAYRHADGP